MCENQVPSGESRQCGECMLQCIVVNSMKPALAAASKMWHNRMRRAHVAAAMRQPFGTIELQIELMYELQFVRIFDVHVRI